MKRKKKTERQKIVEKLDGLASKIHRERAGGRCELCGRMATQVHHYFGRARYGTRWQLDNLLSVCWSCHVHKCHQFPESTRDYLIGRIGKEKFNILKAKASKPACFSLSDLKKILENFEKV